MTLVKTAQHTEKMVWFIPSDPSDPPVECWELVQGSKSILFSSCLLIHIHLIHAFFSSCPALIHSKWSINVCQMNEWNQMCKESNYWISGRMNVLWLTIWIKQYCRWGVKRKSRSGCMSWISKRNIDSIDIYHECIHTRTQALVLL